MKKTKLTQKGFTLIELLAVIIILGVLLLIAVPSISKYIETSRRNTYISQVKQLVNSTATSVNALEFPFNIGKNEGLIIPFSEVNMEKNSPKVKSPYAKFVPEKSYVLVYYDGIKYNYYVSALDEAGNAIPLVNEKNLSTNSLITDKNIIASDMVSYQDIIKGGNDRVFETNSITLKHLNHKDNITKISICQTPYSKGNIIQLKDGSKWYAIQNSSADSELLDVVSYYHMNTTGNLGEQSNSKTSPTLQFHENQSVTEYRNANAYPTMERIATEASIKLSSSTKLNMGSANVKIPEKEDFCSGSDCDRPLEYLNGNGKFWTKNVRPGWVTTISKEGVGNGTADNYFGVRIVIKNLPKSNVDKKATKALNP